VAPSKKTWIWIIVTIAGLCIVSVLAVAAFGIFFVSQHVSTSRATSVDADRRFDEIRATFKDKTPLLEIDSSGQPHPVRPLHELPGSTVKPESLSILAWNPREGRIAKISLPFWIMRLGRDKIDISSGDHHFDFDSLDLDVRELERVGPSIVIDITRASGERVLVWTQ
jgi:hypothetical protein